MGGVGGGGRLRGSAGCPGQRRSALIVGWRAGSACGPRWRQGRGRCSVSLAGTVWIPVGPSPLLHGTREDNGLVTAIAVNSNNANVIYIGTAGGGVWRTSD